MALYTPYKYPLAGSGMPKPEPPDNPWANPNPTRSVMGGVNPPSQSLLPGYTDLAKPLVEGTRALRSGLGLSNPSLSAPPAPDTNVNQGDYPEHWTTRLARTTSALTKPGVFDPEAPFDASSPNRQRFGSGMVRGIPNLAGDLADSFMQKNSFGLANPNFGGMIREGFQQTPFASKGTAADTAGENVAPFMLGGVPNPAAATRSLYNWKPTAVPPAQFFTRTGIEGRPANLQGVPFQVQRYPLGSGMVDYHAYTTPKPSWANLYPQPEHMGSALMAKLGPSWQSQFTSTEPKWRTVRNSMWGPDQQSLGVAGHIYDEAERWHAVTPDINLSPDGQAYWIARDKANGTDKFREMVRSRFQQAHDDYKNGMDPNAVENRLDDISETYQHPRAIPIVRAEEERIRKLLGQDTSYPYNGMPEPEVPAVVRNRPPTAQFTDEPPQDVPKGDTIEGEFTAVPDDGTTPARFATKTPKPEDFNQSQFAGHDDFTENGVPLGEQPPLQLPKVDKSTPTGADWDTLQKLLQEAKGFVGHQGAPLPFNYRPAVDPSRPLFPPQSYNPNPDLAPWGLHPNDDIRAHVADRIYNRMIGEQTLQPWQEGWGTQNPQLGQQIELSDFIRAGNNLKTEGVLPTKYQTDPKYAAMREHFRAQGHDIPPDAAPDPVHDWHGPAFPSDHPFVGMPEPTWLTNPRLGDKFQDFMKDYEDKFRQQLYEHPTPVTPADIPKSYTEMMDDNNLHPMVKKARDYIIAQSEATAQQRHFMFDTLMMRLDAMTRAPVHPSGQRPFHAPRGSGWPDVDPLFPPETNPNLEHIRIPPEINMALAKAKGYTRDAVRNMIHDYTFNYEPENPDFMKLRQNLLELGFKDYALKAEYNRLIQGLQNPGAPE